MSKIETGIEKNIRKSGVGREARGGIKKGYPDLAVDLR